MRQYCGENQEMHLCYCPMCAEEDIGKYGEMYWHTPHQIQMMPLCPKHKCRLKSSGIKINQGLNYRFIEVSPLVCPDMDVGYDPIEKKYITFTNMLYYFWKERGHKDLELFRKRLFLYMQNRDYFPIAAFKVEHEKIMKELQAFWAPDYDSFIREEYFNRQLYGMVESGKFHAPEMYALLLVFLEITPRQIMDPSQIPDEVGNKLRELSDRGYVLAKNYVAKELGVRTRQLDALARMRDIPVFWETIDRTKGDDKKLLKAATIKANITLTKEEEKRMRWRIKEEGFSHISEFVTY